VEVKGFTRELGHIIRVFLLAMFCVKKDDFPCGLTTWEIFVIFSLLSVRNCTFGLAEERRKGKERKGKEGKTLPLEIDTGEVKMK
jgi:hypothetical protein